MWQSIPQTRAFCAVALIVLAGCASPKVHEEVHAMDHRLSCSMMEHEIREMEKHRLSVAESKGFTTRNVLTTAVFFPITLATYGNVDDAQEASMARQKHLMQLYVGKGCADEGVRVARAPAGLSYEPVSHHYVEIDGDVDESLRLRHRYSEAHLRSASYLFN